MVADVDVPGERANGILAAMGDWTGGLAFFVRDGRLVFVLNRAGDEARVESDVPVPPGRHALTAVYTPGFEGPGVGLFHDDELVAHAVLGVPAPMVFQHGGTMLLLGHDRGLPVCADYEPPFRWTGQLHELVIETGPAVEPSLLERMRGLLHHE
jgi:arylsulfatase